MPSTFLTLKLALAAAALVQPALALAQPAANSTAPTGNSTAPYSLNTACRTIALVQEEFFQANPAAKITDFQNVELPAEVAAACLQSVPLNKTNAVAFINWYKPYLQFQSTVGWLKNPPLSYQQSAVDLIGGLDVIASNVPEDKYKGEYEFEVAISRLLNSAHDGHLGVTLPVLSGFRFFPPFTFLSLSSDGSNLPNIYVNGDINNATSKTSWTPSPVTSINGQEAVHFFTAYVKDVFLGNVDPQADWNSLFDNAARQTNANRYPGFGRSDRIPADFNVTLTFANGSFASGVWTAIAVTDFRQVKTPQDFYDHLVAPDVAVESEVETPAVVTKQVNTWGAPYPTPVIAQRDLTEGGLFTGYFLNASSTAVISLPSFDFGGRPDLLKGYQDVVESFLARCKQANMKKLVIDLQGNGGGDLIAGFDLFKQLFPTLEPFGGNQLRVTNAVNILGTNMGTAINETRSDISETYTFSKQLDINNKAFTSWPDMLGPLDQGGDQFTNLFRTQLKLFNPFAAISGYESRANLSAQAFLAKDILLLTDGSCGSTCTVLAEEMHTQAGVKIVVVGGPPEFGPMQGVAGVRGSEVLNLKKFQSLINFTTARNTSISPDLLPSLSTAPIRIKDLFINVRNQLRQSKPDVPLQFIYQAADCRIWYTQAMIKNYEVLWQAAADAIWTDQELCIKGSTNHPSSKRGVTTVTAVAKSGNDANLSAPIVPYLSNGAAEDRSQYMGLSMAAFAGALAIAVSLL